MKTVRFLSFFATLAAAFAAQAQTAPATNTTRRPEPAYAPVMENPNLPRVLLIGDSISVGYTLLVRERLQGRANVLRPAENCSESANGVLRLDAWLGDQHWDVIHFNFGLHDLKYLDAAGKYVPPDQGKQVALLPEYERNLRTIVARLKRTGAKLIFATTTPVPDKSSGRVEHDELRYNEVAQRVMKELGVAIDDLHAVVAPRQSTLQQPHNVHFTPEGYEVLADAVTAAITPGLPKPKK